MTAKPVCQNTFYQKDTETYPGIEPSRKLRVGIIGAGWSAKSHLTNYMKMPDVEIVAGADLIPGKAKAFFRKFGVEYAQCYGSYKEMLDAEELDAVSVRTYNATHVFSHPPAQQSSKRFCTDCQRRLRRQVRPL